MDTPNISNQRRTLEILAIFITGLGKFIFMDMLNYRLPYISIAILLWLIYILIRVKNCPDILTYWGFRFDNFPKALRIITPFALTSIALFIIIGHFQNTLNLTWHLIPILLIYPIWGIVQQFLVIGLVAGNLNDHTTLNFNKINILLLTAILFGAIHYPSIWLMVGTFVLAIVYGYIYLKIKNLWTLGIVHGWLGAIFFYTVVNRNPFLEVFGKYLNN